MSSSLRERRRAAASREILDAARDMIATHGPAGLSLRSVARRIDMTVQALYHYFPSREELITALITEAYNDLAAAVENASPGLPAAASAFRSWGLANAPLFQLIYGTPLINYEAPGDGRTTAAASRLASAFAGALFGAYSPAQLAEADFPPLSRALPGGPSGVLPPPAAALFLSAWGHLHGLVTLEVFGHTAFVGAQQAEVFRSAMLALQADIHRRVCP